MKIVISESQYNILMNELGGHNPKEFLNLIKWVDKHTSCTVTSKNNVYTICPPRDLYPNCYKAHNTPGAVVAIINFIKKVYNKTSEEVRRAFYADVDLI